jgi:predicted DNA-binding transcriptional regulator YafY
MFERSKTGRIAYMINELAEKGFFTKSGLEKYVLESTGEVLSDSSIRRSVNDLRDYFGLSVIYNKKDNIYIVKDKRYGVPDAENFIDRLEVIKRKPSGNQDLLIFYSFVKSMIFSEYYFPPRQNRDESGKVRDYDDILRIIESILKEELSEKDIRLAGRIEYHVSEHYKKNQRMKFNSMINAILDSIRHEYMIRFKYHGIEILTEPVKIIHYNGIWYLMAYVFSSPKPDSVKKVRTYNLALIEGNIFKTKEKFSGEEYQIPEYKSTFGIISSSHTDTAVIRFYGELAERMKEVLWVDTQTTSEGEDPVKGRYCQYELLYPVKNNFELIGKVLSFRGNAEIISPSELREIWVGTIKKMYDSIN